MFPTYSHYLFALFEERMSAFADLVCHWFERARDHVEQHKAKRVGLLATQGIRGGVNRRVLERIKNTGDIFFAWSDRPWILDGAAVRVSKVDFDNRVEWDTDPLLPHSAGGMKGGCLQHLPIFVDTASVAMAQALVNQQKRLQLGPISGTA